MNDVIPPPPCGCEDMEYCDDCFPPGTQVAE